MKQFFIGIVVLIGALIIGGWGLVRYINFFPQPQMTAEQQCQSKAAKLKPGDKIKILSWNIQFGGSLHYHFFYDGGKDVMISSEHVQETLDAITKVLQKHKPDVILWQEMDRNSDRTGRVDQLKKLLKKTPYACWSSTPYHWSRYLPHPSHQHLKRVDMELSIFSRYPLKQATRHALPLMQESFLRRAFNLKRAVLDVTIPIEGGGELRVFDTHFSAFSKGDGTMTRQVKTLSNLLQSAEKKKQHWIAAGDLNLLSPGDDPNRLGQKARVYYAEKGKNPILPLFKNFRSALSLEEYKQNPKLYNTYHPYGKDKADRWIDHVFVSKKLKVSNYKVIHSAYTISDHLPVIFEIQIPGGKPAEKPVEKPTEKPK